MTNFHFLPVLQFSKIKIILLGLSGFFIVVVIMSANHSKGPRFEPGHNHLVIVFYIVISFFFLISKKVVAEVLKITILFPRFELGLLKSNYKLLFISPWNQFKKMTKMDSNLREQSQMD